MARRNEDRKQMRPAAARSRKVKRNIQPRTSLSSNAKKALIWLTAWQRHTPLFGGIPPLVLDVVPEFNAQSQSLLDSLEKAGCNHDVLLASAVVLAEDPRALRIGGARLVRDADTVAKIRSGIVRLSRAPLQPSD